MAQAVPVNLARLVDVGNVQIEENEAVVRAANRSAIRNFRFNFNIGCDIALLLQPSPVILNRQPITAFGFMHRMAFSPQDFAFRELPSFKAMGIGFAFARIRPCRRQY